MRASRSYPFQLIFFCNSILFFRYLHFLICLGHELEARASLGGNFDWKLEFKDLQKEVYKLTIVNNSSILQGLLSITIEQDHIYINLLESSPFNIGKDKLYEGVAGNLVAYACKVSFQKGFDGFVAFTAKTNLIKHYKENLGAFHFKNQRMIIETESAKKLVKKYFKS